MQHIPRTQADDTSSAAQVPCRSFGRNQFLIPGSCSFFGLKTRQPRFKDAANCISEESWVNKFQTKEVIQEITSSMFQSIEPAEAYFISKLTNFLKLLLSKNVLIELITADDEIVMRLGLFSAISSHVQNGCLIRSTKGYDGCKPIIAVGDPQTFEKKEISEVFSEPLTLIQTQSLAEDIIDGAVFLDQLKNVVSSALTSTKPLCGNPTCMLSRQTKTTRSLICLTKAGTNHVPQPASFSLASKIDLSLHFRWLKETSSDPNGRMTEDLSMAYIYDSLLIGAKLSFHIKQNFDIDEACSCYIGQLQTNNEGKFNFPGVKLCRDTDFLDEEMTDSLLELAEVNLHVNRLFSLCLMIRSACTAECNKNKLKFFGWNSYEQATEMIIKSLGNYDYDNICTSVRNVLSIKEKEEPGNSLVCYGSYSITEKDCASIDLRELRIKFVVALPESHSQKGGNPAEDKASPTRSSPRSVEYTPVEPFDKASEEGSSYKSAGPSVCSVHPSENTEQSVEVPLAIPDYTPVLPTKIPNFETDSEATGIAKQSEVNESIICIASQSDMETSEAPQSRAREAWADMQSDSQSEKGGNTVSSETSSEDEDYTLSSDNSSNQDLEIAEANTATDAEEKSQLLLQIACFADTDRAVSPLSRKFKEVESLVFKSEIKLANQTDTRQRKIKIIKIENVNDFFQYLYTHNIPANRNGQQYLDIRNTGFYKMISDGQCISSFSLTNLLQQRNNNILAFVLFSCISKSEFGSTFLNLINEAANFAIYLNFITEILEKEIGQQRAQIVMEHIVFDVTQHEVRRVRKVRCSGCTGITALVDYALGDIGKANTTAPSLASPDRYSFGGDHTVSSLEMNHRFFDGQGNVCFGTTRMITSEVVLRTQIIDETGFLTTLGESLVCESGCAKWSADKPVNSSEITLVTRMSQSVYDNLISDQLLLLVFSPSLKSSLNVSSMHLQAINRMISRTQGILMHKKDTVVSLQNKTADYCFNVFYKPHEWEIKAIMGREVKDTILSCLEAVCNFQRICKTNQFGEIKRVWVESWDDHYVCLKYGVANNRVGTISLPLNHLTENGCSNSGVSIVAGSVNWSYNLGSQEPTVCSPLWSISVDRDTLSRIQIISTLDSLRLCVKPTKDSQRKWIYYPSNTIRHLAILGDSEDIKAFCKLYRQMPECSSMRGIIIPDHSKTCSIINEEFIVVGMLKGVVKIKPEQIKLEYITGDCLGSQFCKPLNTESEMIKNRCEHTVSATGTFWKFNINKGGNASWFDSEMRALSFYIQSDDEFNFCDCRLNQIIKGKSLNMAQFNEYNRKVINTILEFTCDSYENKNNVYTVDTLDPLTLGLVTACMSQLPGLSKLVNSFVSNRGKKFLSPAMMTAENVNKTIFGIRSVIDFGSTQYDYSWRVGDQSDHETEIASIKELSEKKNIAPPIAALAMHLNRDSIEVPSGIKSHVTKGLLSTKDGTIASGYNELMMVMNKSLNTSRFTFGRLQPAETFTSCLLFCRDFPYSSENRYIDGETVAKISNIITNSVVSSSGLIQANSSLKFHKLYLFFCNSEIELNEYAAETFGTSGIGTVEGLSLSSEYEVVAKSSIDKDIIVKKNSAVSMYERALAVRSEDRERVAPTFLRLTPLDTYVNECTTNRARRFHLCLGAVLKILFGTRACNLAGLIWQVIRNEFQNYLNKINLFNCITKVIQGDFVLTVPESIVLCSLCAESSLIRMGSAIEARIANSVNLTAVVKRKNRKFELLTNVVENCNSDLLWLNDPSRFPVHYLMDFEVQESSKLLFCPSELVVKSYKARLHAIIDSDLTDAPIHLAAEEGKFAAFNHAIIAFKKFFKNQINVESLCEARAIIAKPNETSSYYENGKLLHTFGLSFI